MGNIQKINFFNDFMSFIDNFNRLDYADIEEINTVFIDFMNLYFTQYIAMLENDFIFDSELTADELKTVLSLLETMRKYNVII